MTTNKQFTRKKQLCLFAVLLLVSSVSHAQLGSGLLKLKDKLAGKDSAGGVKGKDYVSIEIRQKEATGYNLGQELEIGIVAKNDKDKEYKTPGFLAPGTFKTVEWNQFKIEVEGGKFADGKVIISGNPADIKNHEVKIKAATIKNAEIKSEWTVKLNYTGNIVADFSGTPGERGYSGQNGQRGANAVTSSDKCGSGGNGGPGGNGGNGDVGQDIEVFAKMKYDEVLKKELLHVLVKSKTTGKSQTYLVNPEGGKIKVSADGGYGGSGGQGGQGGQGGDDSYRQASGNGGNGGSGGVGGNGANGGTITAYMDPSTDKLPAGVITFSNEGGEGGYRGEAGIAGAKGYYNSNWGQQGAYGTYGQAGKKGPQVKILKQKVD
jgi:hypothetical protein